MVTWRRRSFLPHKESHRPSSSSFRIQISAPRCPLLAKVLQKYALNRPCPLQSRRAIGMPDSGGATVFDDLPEWLVVADILIRLPVKDILRCRAVRKSWRSGNSTDAFIMAHRRRQPTLPTVEDGKGICGVAGASGGPKMRPVIRYPILNALDKEPRFITCDGLVILQQRSDFYICNPATRKWASLPHPPPRVLEGYFNAVDVIGCYRHHPSGEHWALWVSYSIDTRNGLFTPGEVVLPDYSVLTVGSDQPRCIQWPTVSKDGFPAVMSFHIPPIHLRANLHWLATGKDITVFHTIAETFRQMSHPAWPGAPVGNALMDIGGALALSGTTRDGVTLYVWVLQNYDAEIWSCQYRIKLSAIPLLNIQYYAARMAVINERELLIGQDRVRLLHCGIDGVFLGNVESEEHELTLTKHRFQESMISLPLFEAQEEDAVNTEPPFSILL